MPIILGENQTAGAPYIQRKIRCPGHYLIPPHIDIYLREPIPEFKNCRNFIDIGARKMKIRKERIKVDAFGRKMVDWRKLRKLRDVGQVIQPAVSAAWCIENIYDPLSHLCQIECRASGGQFCKEGQGRVLTHTINRLCGKKCKER